MHIPFLPILAILATSPIATQESTQADAMRDLALRIAGNETSIALPLSGDGSFTLPRSAQADSEDAGLISNKKKGQYRWQPAIQSDGVPAGMRRLGDLRLQCQVMIAIAKQEIPFWVRILVGTLLAGEQRIALKVEKRESSFLAPIGDTRYAHDTLIELAYQQDRAATPPASP